MIAGGWGGQEMRGVRGGRGEGGEERIGEEGRGEERRGEDGEKMRGD